MIRLYGDFDLAHHQTVTLSADQAHYLGSVMRKKIGDHVLLFNGRAGEWCGEIIECRKKYAEIRLLEQTRGQDASPDLWLLFAPIKKNRLDFLIEKATELGVSTLCPILSRRTIVSKVRTDRLVAQAIEAAEQCERLNSPHVREPVPLTAHLESWPEERTLFVLDEHGGAPAIATVLAACPQNQPAAFLVGPEGGFERSELDLLSKLPFVKRLSLGPRILRAETAAVAALSCWQALQGDWGVPLRNRTAAPLEDV